MTTTLSNEQRALLEKVDKWSMSDPLVMAVGAALATIDAQREEIERLKTALQKISDIRDSIVGGQTFNWSEHAYPLVAALEEAGFKGKGYEIGRKNLGTLIEQIKAAESRIAALEAELDRWRHGAPIEGDFVCPDSLRAAALEVENARLRGSIKHAHGCLLDAGVTMPGDPLAGVSDGIRALEAENAALRDESERHRICAVAGWTVARIVSVANNDSHCVQRADEVLDALRKEGK